MTKDLVCPECGAPMVLRKTDKFSYESGQPRYFYGCSRWPLCQATHGAHPNGEPMGIPADKETKEWRIRAHEAFDDWWGDKGLTRREGYLRLAEHFGIKGIHIGELNVEGCQKVIKFCEDDGKR